MPFTMRKWHTLYYTDVEEHKKVAFSLCFALVFS